MNVPKIDALEDKRSRYIVAMEAAWQKCSVPKSKDLNWKPCFDNMIKVFLAAGEGSWVTDEEMREELIMAGTLREDESTSASIRMLIDNTVMSSTDPGHEFYFEREPAVATEDATDTEGRDGVRYRYVWNPSGEKTEPMTEPQVDKRLSYIYSPKPEAPQAPAPNNESPDLIVRKLQILGVSPHALRNLLTVRYDLKKVLLDVYDRHLKVEGEEVSEGWERLEVKDTFGIEIGEEDTDKINRLKLAVLAEVPGLAQAEGPSKRLENIANMIIAHAEAIRLQLGIEG